MVGSFPETGDTRNSVIFLFDQFELHRYFTTSTGHGARWTRRFHYERRAWCEVDEPIRPASDQALINSGMTGRPDNKQIGLKFFGKCDNVAHRMPGYDMGMKVDVAFLRHSACALMDFVEAPGCHPDL